MDFLATELMGELKEENRRKDEMMQSMHKRFFVERVIYLGAVLFTVLSCLVYLYQYDFFTEVTTTTTTTSTGFYSLVDSSGNTIAANLSEEAIESIMEGFGYGEITGIGFENTDNDSSEGTDSED